MSPMPFTAAPLTASTDARVLDCRGHLLDCRHGAHVMGILNVTPDSFSDGNRYLHLDDALARAEVMIEEGATLIDIGGESTRPRGSAYGAGAEPVDAGEEKRRVIPVVEELAKRFPHTLLSIDTYKGDVARAALSAGAHLVNDVGGVRDGVGTARAAADYGAPLVLMHALGRPGAMPHEAQLVTRSSGEADVVNQVAQSLRRSVARAADAGARDLVVDPGFGFGKTPHDNLRLIAGLDRIAALGRPVLVGISRKQTVGILLGTAERPAPIEERLFGTLGLTALAVLRGASIVRTHDVRPTVELLATLNAAEATCPSDQEAAL